jgi:hypothetical protein
MSALPPDELRGPTSEEASWDILSSRSDEVASHSSDFNGIGTAFGNLDSHPSDMSLPLSADSDEVTLAFQERDDILKAKLASVETQIDYMTSTANFPNLSSEEIMSRREAREQARADLVRLKEENQANRVRYDKLRVSHHQPRQARRHILTLSPSRRILSTLPMATSPLHRFWPRLRNWTELR